MPVGENYATWHPSAVDCAKGTQSCKYLHHTTAETASQDRQQNQNQNQPRFGRSFLYPWFPLFLNEQYSRKGFLHKSSMAASASSSSSENERQLHYDIGYKFLHNYGSLHRQRSRAISFSSSSSALDESPDIIGRAGGFSRPRKDAKASEIRGEFYERGLARHEFKSRRGMLNPTPAVSRMLETSCLHRNNCHGCVADQLDGLHVNNCQVPLSDQGPRLACLAGGDISIIRNDVQHRVLDTYSQQAVKNNSMHEVAMHARDRLQEKFRAASLFSNRMQTASIAPRVVYYSPSEEYVDCIDQETNIRNRLSSRSGESEEILRSELSTRRNSRPQALTKTAITNFPREVFVPTVRIGESEDKKLVLEKEECPICLEPFLSGEQMIKLSCFHRFHIVCLSPWLLIHRECPYCRSICF